MHRSRHLGVVVAVLLAAACGGAAPAATPSRSPATPAPSATPAPGRGETRPASPSPPGIAVCRLPVAAGDAPADGHAEHGATGHGGFVDLPAGTFTADPRSLAAYDRSVARWLPVPRAWLAPDGAHYAYPEYRPPAPGPVTGTIHVVDVGSGADRAIAVPAPSMPVSYDAAGIYIARVVPSSDAPPAGLSLLDPATGALRQIIADGVWTDIGSAAAWGADLDPGVAQGSSGGPGAANRVRRLDLASGAVTVYATYPGNNVQVLGVDTGSPVLRITAGTRATLTGPAGPMFDGPVADSNPARPVVFDGARIWLSSQAGTVWLFEPGGPARQVATTPLQLAQVVGGCR